MDTPAIAQLINGLTVTGRLTTDHATSSYGRPVFVDDDGQAYSDADIAHVAALDGPTLDQPGKYQQVYDALAHYVPSAKTPHLDALAAAGLLDALSVEQLTAIVKLMQAAYSAGKHDAGAEVIDPDAVWIDSIGAIERQADGSWMAAGALSIAQASAETGIPVSTLRRAAALGQIPGARRVGERWVVTRDGLLDYRAAPRKSGPKQK